MSAAGARGVLLPVRRFRVPLRRLNHEAEEELQEKAAHLSRIDSSFSPSACSSGLLPQQRVVNYKVMFPHVEGVEKLNRKPSLHVLGLANELLSLTEEELVSLRKECRKRLSVKPAQPIPGLSARSAFPHPKNYFRGENGMRTLPVSYTVFEPGISLPMLSPYFGTKAPPSSDYRSEEGESDPATSSGPAEPQEGATQK